MSTTTVDRHRRYWDVVTPRYDAGMRVMDRLVFRDTRAWVCARAHGTVLEVAIGTGLNLERYDPSCDVVGVDTSATMLEVAGRRARRLGCPTRLLTADAVALPFGDASFDTVVCTFGLCGMPDPAAAIAEMVRVLRPGGSLVVADHTASAHPVARVVQRVADRILGWQAGVSLRHRPRAMIAAAGLVITTCETLAGGAVVRVLAVVGSHGA